MPSRIAKTRDLVQYRRVFLNFPNTFNPGDVVEAGSFPVHVGVYLGNGLFFHNAKDKKCVVTDEAGFSRGRVVRLRSKFSGSYLELQQVIARARRLDGQPYDLLTFNCEHAAYYAREGKMRSPQLAFALLGLVVLSGLVLANRQG